MMKGDHKMKKKVLIEGMSCGHCVRHVQEALSELAGVKSVEVSLEAGTAVLEAPGNVQDEEITFAVEDAGYTVVRIED